MSDLVSLEDRGLDLVLGGGLRRVRRVGDKHATVLLVRGAGGSGKTLVGFHAACALAKTFGGPIAYACIELLPTELEAQIRAQRSDLTQVQIRHRESEAVDATTEGGVIVEARLIDLGEGPEALGTGLEHFIERLTKTGPPPGVLVIDSLIDGYGIGTSASREFVDSVCKLAAHWGIALVLLEECAPGSTSPWIFAADTVLELGLMSEDGDALRPSPHERRLSVLKHRFGPSDAGPHRFLLDPGEPVRVLPRPSVWLEPWTAALAEGVGVPNDPRRHEAGQKLQVPIESSGKESRVGLVVAVFGSAPRRLYEIAFGLQRQDRQDALTLEVSFTVPLGDREPSADRRVLGVSHPYLSAHRFLRVVLDEIQALSGLRRIVIADLRVLRSLSNADELRRAVGVLCLLVRRLGIPLVLVESSANRMTTAETNRVGVLVSQAPGQEVASCVDFADLSIEVYVMTDATSARAVVTDLRSGRTAMVKPSSATP